MQRRDPAGAIMRRALMVPLMVTGLLIGFVAPASAAGGLPDTRFHVLSVMLDARSGSVVVVARTQCSGNGSMSWDVSVRQGHVRSAASRDVPCDGTPRTQTLALEPRTGRFHAGGALYIQGEIICGTDICIGAATAHEITLRPNHSSV